MVFCKLLDAVHRRRRALAKARVAAFNRRATGNQVNAAPIAEVRPANNRLMVRAQYDLMRRPKINRFFMHPAAVQGIVAGEVLDARFV
jgi:hypothetical protein